MRWVIFEVSEKIDRWQGEPQPHLSRTDTSSRQRADPEAEESARYPQHPYYGPAIWHRAQVQDLHRKCSAGRLIYPPSKARRPRSLLSRKGWNGPSWAYCYDILGVDFPERGGLLFWQLPLDDKMKYFEIEDRIADLKGVADPGDRKRQLDQLLAFLGANPVQKVDRGVYRPVRQGDPGIPGFVIPTPPCRSNNGYWNWNRN